MGPTAVVTGAFGHVGRAAAEALAARGWTVRTLTNRDPAPGDPPWTRAALRFDRSHLAAALAGADVLVNTYWVRLPAHGATFEEGVRNSATLVDAAVAARVRRIVQVSVSNARPDAPTPYYRGKAAVERHVRERASSWGIVRPTLVVGPRDVLTNNMAWLARHAPLLLVPGDAEYPIQPITLGDTARLVADAAESSECTARDVAGSERYSFRAYVDLVAEAVGSSRRTHAVPPRLFRAVTALAGAALRDVLVSEEEMVALRWGALASDEPPLGRESVRAWLTAHGTELGRRYANDRRARAPSSRAARRAG